MPAAGATPAGIVSLPDGIALFAPHPRRSSTRRSRRDGVVPRAAARRNRVAIEGECNARSSWLT